MWGGTPRARRGVKGISGHRPTRRPVPVRSPPRSRHGRRAMCARPVFRHPPVLHVGCCGSGVCRLRPGKGSAFPRHEMSDSPGDRGSSTRMERPAQFHPLSGDSADQRTVCRAIPNVQPAPQAVGREDSAAPTAGLGSVDGLGRADAQRLLRSGCGGQSIRSQTAGIRGPLQGEIHAWLRRLVAVRKPVRGDPVLEGAYSLRNGRSLPHPRPQRQTCPVDLRPGQ